jgi:hypothetical protein
MDLYTAYGTLGLPFVLATKDSVTGYMYDITRGVCRYILIEVKKYAAAA